MNDTPAMIRLRSPTYNSFPFDREENSPSSIQTANTRLGKTGDREKVMRALAAVHHIRNRWLLLVGLTTLLVSFVIWTSETVLGSCVVPTVPGNASNIAKWVLAPVLYASSDTAERQEEVDAWVDCQGWGSPPFTWTVTGTGFSLSKARTYSDQETNVLSAGGTACGSAIIQVSDSRGVTASGSVRCPSSGKWEPKGYYCGFDQVVPASEYRYGKPYHYFKAYHGNKRVDMTITGSGGSGTCSTPWQDYDYSYYCAERDCHKYISKARLDPKPCIDTTSLVSWSLCECYESTIWNCMFPKGISYFEWECR